MLQTISIFLLFLSCNKIFPDSFLILPQYHISIGSIIFYLDIIIYILSYSFFMYKEFYGNSSNCIVSKFSNICDWVYGILK